MDSANETQINKTTYGKHTIGIGLRARKIRKFTSTWRDLVLTTFNHPKVNFRYLVQPSGDICDRSHMRFEPECGKKQVAQGIKDGIEAVKKGTRNWYDVLEKNPIYQRKLKYR